MHYDDYHSPAICKIEEDNFFNELKKLCGANYEYYGPSYLDNIIKNDKLQELMQKYEINVGYFIYWILAMYASNQVPETTFDNSLIQNFDLNQKQIETELGKFQFDLLVKSLGGIFKQKNPLHFKYYYNIYRGKALGYCHKYTLEYPESSVQYVTAFIPIWFKGLKYLHSYVESTDGNIIDVSRNLVLPKTDFETLVNPEVVSIITPEEYQEDYPLLKKHPEITTREYLVNKPKVKRKIKR